jgi:hypothetical protein
MLMTCIHLLCNHSIGRGARKNKASVVVNIMCGTRSSRVLQCELSCCGRTYRSHTLNMTLHRTTRSFYATLHILRATTAHVHSYSTSVDISGLCYIYFKSSIDKLLMEPGDYLDAILCKIMRFV